MVRIPLRPLTMPSHAVATVLPIGETMPSPVMTTLRLVKLSLSAGWAVAGRSRLHGASGTQVRPERGAR